MMSSDPSGTHPVAGVSSYQALSASKLASNGNAFAYWSGACDVVTKDITDDISRILDEAKQGFSLPKSYGTTKLPPFPWKTRDVFDVWVYRLYKAEPHLFTEDENDPFMFFHNKYFLAEIMSDIKESTADPEESQRRGIDRLLRMVFAHHPTTTVKSEVAIHLVKNPAFVEVMPTGVTHADTTVFTKEIPKNLHESIRPLYGDRDLLHEAYWTHACQQHSALLFSGEFKRDERVTNPNQLIMTFATAHAHRIFLGLSKTPIFGATSAGGLFRIWVSWVYSTGEASTMPSKNLIAWRETNTSFELGTPQGIHDAYFFLCKLRDGHLTKMAREFSTFTFDQTIENARNHRWRTPGVPPKTPSKTGSKAGSKRSRSEAQPSPGDRRDRATDYVDPMESDTSDQDSSDTEDLNIPLTATNFHGGFRDVFLTTQEGTIVTEWLAGSMSGPDPPC